MAMRSRREATWPTSMQVMLDIGPKSKKVVAVAPDWSGLERGGKSEEDGLNRLRTSLLRYAGVAERAGLGGTFCPEAVLDVVERYPGVGSTDFRGIWFASSEIDRQGLVTDELERQIAPLRACWTFFDGVRSPVSAELRTGLRGGNRDRGAIVGPVLGAERGYTRRIGVRTPAGRCPPPVAWTSTATPSARLSVGSTVEGRTAGNGRCGTSSAAVPGMSWTTRGRWETRR